MKSIFRLFLLLALASPAAFAQLTAVTATVVDSDSTAWANGTFSALYMPVPGYPGNLVNSATGQVLSPNPVTGTMNGSGVLSINLPQTKYIFGPNQSAGNSPGVVFTVCPQMGPPCWQTAPIVITGTSQSVSTQINAVIVAPRIAGVTPWQRAYNDTEVASTNGNCYVRLSDGTVRSYTTGTGWAAGCTGGTAAGTVTVASGALALATSSISSAACQAVTAGTTNSAAATGVLTTDSISFTPNGSIAAVTGFTPATTGGLTIVAYPTAGFVNFDVCNWSASPITPGAVTLNWRVTR